jgi:hypothetical protein
MVSGTLLRFLLGGCADPLNIFSVALSKFLTSAMLLAILPKGSSTGWRNGKA